MKSLGSYIGWLMLKHGIYDVGVCYSVRQIGVEEILGLLVEGK